MNQLTQQQKIVIALRVILSGLFFLSAISKMMPIGFFEKMLVDLKVASWDSTVYISRTILTVEFFLAFALIQNSYFKKLILPATAGLLLAFTAHLFYEGFTNPKGFFEGNCGCFGDLIPLSIFWSIVKNFAMLGMAYYVYKKTESNDKQDLKTMIIMFLGSLLIVTLAANNIPRYTLAEEDEYTNNEEVANNEFNENDPLEADTLVNDTTSTEIEAENAEEKSNQTQPENSQQGDKTTQEKTNTKPDGNQKETTTQKENEESTQQTQTSQVKSKFAKYTSFSDGKSVNLDKGRKLVCLFSLTCEHCQGAYKDLCALGKQMTIPDMYILAYGDKADVDYFYEQAGSDCNHPYKLLPYMEFLPLLGESNFPLIVLMEDGKELGSWDYDTYEIGKVKAAIQALK